MERNGFPPDRKPAPTNRRKEGAEPSWQQTSNPCSASARLPGTGEGLVLADYPGCWEAARELAGLAWDPIAEPVYALTGMDEQGPVYAQLDGWKRIARSDTGTTLSVNRDSYALIDHGEMGEIVEAVLELPHVKWETAGSLDGGRAVWCLALLDEPVTLPGDDTVTLPYLAITNRHDGTGACTLRATAVRVVCANTFRAASSRESAPAPPTRSATSRAGATG